MICVCHVTMNECTYHIYSLYDEEKDEKTLLRKLVGLDIQVQAQHNSHVDDKRTFSGTLAYNEDADSFLLHDKV